MGQTKCHTFVFLSYGDMDVFLLQLSFWNVPKINPTVEISTTKDLNIYYIKYNLEKCMPIFQFGITSNLRYINLT